MKKLLKISFLLFAATFLLFCKGKPEESAEASGTSYTCPMHPQIVQPAPGTCPICGMDLVPVERNADQASLTLSESQRLLANITTDTVRTGAFSSAKQLNGRVVIDPEQIEYVTSRVPGRIENLYVRETGVTVKKGQTLYRIYSEQLASLQQEYLVAVAQTEQFPDNARFQSILEAARQRLELYDQSPQQLEALRTGKKTDPYVSYPAPASGVVAELFVTEGQYVPEGGSVLRLEGYRSVWIEADIYPSEAGLIKKGQSVEVRAAGGESDARAMRIDFIEPALQAGSQLLTLRGSLSNPGDQYRPGMQVFVQVPVSVNSKAVTLPVDAVIRDGSGAHVWLETEPGTFKAQSVRLGAENFDRVEITEGLKEGEVAVLSGAYLLYSEYVLKKGKIPAGEHNH
ncbi:efflux RND transporter periplasmic adaptor subunit [Persicitalea jodogahamensis]|uniref:RND transporter n=1 Tax=Persicitalea jodogahamensis TaxID=402147 RepID=A0A8J3D8I8_9BACT|nr:efflux RND transporter periplasmic adaptor subunit [Persicitalea jodogahamensis]GHB87654.1 RND transporter [Persicitalea jodogahamensis]